MTAETAAQLPDHPPTLVCLIGPPAVGKMTVGQALAAQTGFHLFHGHVVADALSSFFPFGTPHFRRLSDEWRRTFFVEACAAGLHVITTVAWRFDLPADAAAIDAWLQPYRLAGRVCAVELIAPLAVRMERNRMPERQAQKNPFWVTDSYLQENDAAHHYASNAAFPFPFDVPHLQLDISTLPADRAAAQIVTHFNLV